MARDPWTPSAGGRARGLTTSLVAATCLSVVSCIHHAPAPVDLSDELESYLAGDLVNLRQSVDAHGTGAPDFDLADGLDAREGEVLALFLSPTVRLARRDLGVAVAGTVAAGAWEDPVLGFDGAAVLAPQNLLEYGIGFELTLPLSGRAAAARRTADARELAARADVVEVEWRVRHDVRRAFWSWSAAERSVLEHRELLAALASVDELAEKLRRAGSLAGFESRLVRLRLHAQQLTVLELEAHADSERRGLFALLGLSPRTHIALEPIDLGAAKAANVDIAEQAVLQNPHVLALALHHSVAEAELARQLRLQFPDLTLGFGYGNEDDDRLPFSLRLPIPLWNGNRQAIATALAERDLAGEKLRVALEEAAARLDAMREQLARAEERRVFVANELLPLVDEQSRELAALGDLGRIEPLALLEALSARGSAIDAWVHVELTRASAQIDIDELVGPRDTSALEAQATQP